MNKYIRIAPLALAALGLALSACTSNGESSTGSSSGGGGSSGSNGGGITSSSSSGGPSNTGNGPTNITSSGGAVSGNFICTQGATAYGDVTTAVGANGLVGADLSALLNTLGGSSATTLLNSVTNPNNVIDGNLATYATYTLTVSLFTGAIDSVDLDVIMPSGTTVPAGQFAVFGVSFPKGTVDLSLINKVTVATYLDSTLQESNTLNQSQLGLLGTGVGTPATWVGIEATKPYDTAVLELAPGVLSADVGSAMYAYEFCPGGTLVNSTSSSSSSSSSSGGSSSSGA
jgi:hypothetical protein